MDKLNHFKIIDNGGYYTVINTKANDFDNYHTHITKKKKSKNMNKGERRTCQKLVHWVCNKVVPRSSYLRESAKRISRDEDYIQSINHKIEKDRQKPNYHNVGGRGV